MLVAPHPAGRLHALVDGPQLLIRANKTKAVLHSLLLDCADVQQIVWDPLCDSTEHRLLLVRPASVQIVYGRGAIQTATIDTEVPVLSAQWMDFDHPNGLVVGISVQSCLGLSLWDADGCHRIFTNPLAAPVALPLAKHYACLWRTVRGTNALTFVDANYDLAMFEVPRTESLAASPTQSVVALAGKDGLLLVSPTGAAIGADGLFADVVWSAAHVIASTLAGTLEFYSPALEKRFVVRLVQPPTNATYALENGEYVRCPDPGAPTRELKLLLNRTKEFLAVSSNKSVWVWDVRGKPCVLAVLVHPREPALQWHYTYLTAVVGHEIGLWSPFSDPQVLASSLRSICGVVKSDDGIFVYNKQGTEYLPVIEHVEIPAFDVVPVAETPDGLRPATSGSNLGSRCMSSDSVQDTFIYKKRKLQ